jgi:hypothetical protein
MGNHCCGHPSDVLKDSTLKPNDINRHRAVVRLSVPTSKKQPETIGTLPFFKDDDDDRSQTTEPCSTDGRNNVHDPVETIYLLVDQMSRDAGHFASSAFSFGRSGSSSRSSFSDAREARGERISGKRASSYGSRVDGLRDDIEDEVDAARSIESHGAEIQQSERSTTAAIDH